MHRELPNELFRIDDELSRATSGNAWHGPSLREVLEGVRYDQASQRQMAGCHTIWELVLHLRAWAVEVERRLREPARQLSPEADWPKPDAMSPSSWERTKRDLFDAHEQLRRTVQRLDAGTLEQPLDPRDDTNGAVAVMLHGVSQHLAYHGGQISLMKRLTR